MATWRKAKVDMHKLGVMKTGQMNETEKTYAWLLEAKKRKGEIHDYVFESYKLRMADNCWYVVDFMVIRNDGTLEIHEVKGPFIHEDSIIKLRGIAEAFPFPVFLCQRKKKDLIFEITRIGR